MFRITTANSYASSVANLQARQLEMNTAQTQMTSGKRVLKAGDDPTAAARAERARALIQRAESSQRAVDASKNSMTLTESALGDAGNLLQHARELLVAAGNASYGDSERASVAKELEGIRTQLLGVANRGDGSGGYVFSGQGSSTPPFMDRPGGVSYTGTGGAVHVATDEQLPMTLDGNQVWLSAPSGNGVFTTQANSSGAWIDAGRVTQPSAITGSAYQVQFSVSAGVTTYTIVKDGTTPLVLNEPFKAGQSIEVDGMAFTISGKPNNGDSFDISPSEPSLSAFDALDKAIQGLKTPSLSTSQITQTVQFGLRDLDAVANHLQGARSATGEVLNRIEGIAGRVADLKLFGENTRSDAEDLDMVKAISDFKNQETGYQAALQTYASMQKMSLFQYLNT